MYLQGPGKERKQTKDDGKTLRALTPPHLLRNLTQEEVATRNHTTRSRKNPTRRYMERCQLNTAVEDAELHANLSAAQGLRKAWALKRVKAISTANRIVNQLFSSATGRVRTRQLVEDIPRRFMPHRQINTTSTTCPKEVKKSLKSNHRSFPRDAKTDQRKKKNVLAPPVRTSDLALDTRTRGGLNPVPAPKQPDRFQTRRPIPSARGTSGVRKAWFSGCILAFLSSHPN